MGLSPYPISMSPRQTRRRVLTLAGATGALALAGCLGGDDEPEGSETDDGMDDHVDDHEDDDHDDDDHEEDADDEEMDDDEEDATLRVAHLSPDAPNVDVFIDGVAVLEDVPFRAVSDYLEVTAGTYEVMITAADDPDTVVFDEELEVPEGAFTVAALGELAEENHPFAPEVFEDDVTDPGEEARVRLVHASPDAPAVDVTVGDGETVLFEDVAFGEAAALEVAPDSYELEVRPATDDNDGDVAATFEVAPEAGTVYTAFAVGYLAPDDAPADEAFDLEVVVDASFDDGDGDEYDDEEYDDGDGDEYDDDDGESDDGY